MATESDVFVIPARAGSKRVRNKNKRLLASLPLYQRCINKLEQLVPPKQMIVTTDDHEILEWSQQRGCFSLARDKELASDDASSLDVMIDAIENWTRATKSMPNIVGLIQVTNPFWSTLSLEDALLNVRSENFNSATEVKLSKMSARKLLRLGDDNSLFPIQGTNSDSIGALAEDELAYERTGAFYLCKSKYLFDNKSLLPDPCYGAVSKNIFDVDIDVPIDLEFCEFLISKGLVK